MYFSLFPYNFSLCATYYIRTVELSEAGTAQSGQRYPSNCAMNTSNTATVQISEAEALLTPLNVSPNILKSNSMVCSPCYEPAPQLTGKLAALYRIRKISTMSPCHCNL